MYPRPGKIFILLYNDSSVVMLVTITLKHKCNDIQPDTSHHAFWLHICLILANLPGMSWKTRQKQGFSFFLSLCLSFDILNPLLIFVFFLIHLTSPPFSLRCVLCSTIFTSCSLGLGLALCARWG